MPKNGFGWPALLVAVFIAVSLSFFGYLPYLKLKKNYYRDETYGFALKDQRGWFIMPEQDEFYYFVATKDNDGNPLSTFGISVIDTPHVIESSLGFYYDNFVKACTKSAQDINGQYLKFTREPLNKNTTFRCSFQGDGVHLKETVKIEQYYVFSDLEADKHYMLNVSYPTDHPGEEELVNRIVRGFCLE